LYRRYDRRGAWLRADPGFAAPLAGDYTVTNTAATARIGFVNFPMDDMTALQAWLDASPAGTHELVVVRNQAQIHLAAPHP